MEMMILKKLWMITQVPKKRTIPIVEEKEILMVPATVSPRAPASRNRIPQGLAPVGPIPLRT